MQWFCLHLCKVSVLCWQYITTDLSSDSIHILRESKVSTAYYDESKKLCGIPMRTKSAPLSGRGTMSSYWDAHFGIKNEAEGWKNHSYQVYLDTQTIKQSLIHIDSNITTQLKRLFHKLSKNNKVCAYLFTADCCMITRITLLYAGSHCLLSPFDVTIPEKEGWSVFVMISPG